jgi:hypothetical protein
MKMKTNKSKSLGHGKLSKLLMEKAAEKGESVRDIISTALQAKAIEMKTRVDSLKAKALKRNNLPEPMPLAPVAKQKMDSCLKKGSPISNSLQNLDSNIHSLRTNIDELAEKLDVVLAPISCKSESKCCNEKEQNCLLVEQLESMENEVCYCSEIISDLIDRCQLDNTSVISKQTLPCVKELKTSNPDVKKSVITGVFDLLEHAIELLMIRIQTLSEKINPILEPAGMTKFASEASKKCEDEYSQLVNRIEKFQEQTNNYLLFVRDLIDRCQL